MPKKTHLQNLQRIASNYGMLLILFLLSVLFSILTISEQYPTGAAAVESVVKQISRESISGKTFLIMAAEYSEDGEFGSILSKNIVDSGGKVLQPIFGSPAEIRAHLEKLMQEGAAPDQLITTHNLFPTVNLIKSDFENFKQVEVIEPLSYRWPTFLLTENIKNVANQITVIAIIAIGMTIVILTAGIDLSVGSLIALSAVTVAYIVGQTGGIEASTGSLFLAGIGSIILCGAIGAFSGLMVTVFRIPPFIATLAMMQVAAGMAYIVSEGKPIYQLPENFIWLGRGVDPLLHIPIAVILMLLLYGLAHFVMTRTIFGRYIYAVGGNIEAARLAGIRVNLILLSVYTICGMLAGLGGVVMASQLKSGAPTYGATYELYVIAAVVVGGTSLMGGEGRILGTLIGAFIIAVIQNGMNLVNVESYTQKVVLGLVILGAVLVDRLKRSGLKKFLPKKMVEKFTKSSIIKNGSE